MLLLAEEFMLLALHSDKGTVYQTASIALNLELAGALILELIYLKRLRVRDHILSIVSDTATGNELLDESLQQISRMKPGKPIQYYTQKLSTQIKKLKHRLCDGLVAQCLLKKEEHPVLFFFRTYRYPVRKKKIKREILSRVQTTIRKRTVSDERTGYLVCLLNSCNLMKYIFPKEKFSFLKERIVRFMDKVPENSDIREVIKTIQNQNPAAASAASG